MTFAIARAMMRIATTALAGLLAAYPAVALDSSQCPNATHHDNAGCLSVAQTLNGGEVTPPTTHTVTVTNVCTDYATVELLYTMENESSAAKRVTLTAATPTNTTVFPTSDTIADIYCCNINDSICDKSTFVTEARCRTGFEASAANDYCDLTTASVLPAGEFEHESPGCRFEASCERDGESANVEMEVRSYHADDLDFCLSRTMELSVEPC